MPNGIRSYDELSRIGSFEARYAYLQLGGEVGQATFGSARWMNQAFYKSDEWRDVRHRVILRDQGCDLGVLGHEIYSGLLIHHINPITPQDIRDFDPMIIDPDNLITTTLGTHNAIHYGDASLLPQQVVERRPGDTTLW